MVQCGFKPALNDSIFNFILHHKCNWQGSECLKSTGFKNCLNLIVKIVFKILNT